MVSPNNFARYPELPSPESFSGDLESAIVYADYVFSVISQNPGVNKFELSYRQDLPHICPIRMATPYVGFLATSLLVWRQEFIENLASIGENFGVDFTIPPQLNPDLLVDEYGDLRQVVVYVPDDLGNLTLEPPKSSFGKGVLKLFGPRDGQPLQAKDFGLSGLTDEEAIQEIAKRMESFGQELDIETGSTQQQIDNAYKEKAEALWVTIKSVITRNKSTFYGLGGGV